MPYIKEVCVAGQTVEIRKYYSSRYGKKGKRSPNAKPLDKAHQRANIRRQERELRLLMNQNFRDGRDALVTLSFKTVEPYKEMLQKVQKMIRSIRRIYAKTGRILKYIYTMEVGPRGSRHVHMMLTSPSLQDLVRIWPYGVVDVKPLYSHGQYSKIAAYFMKYADKTEQTLGKKLGRRYNASHNMEHPKIRKTVVMANTFREKIREKPGYYIDRDSIQRGICEETGRPYLHYTYIRDK